LRIVVPRVKYTPTLSDIGTSVGTVSLGQERRVVLTFWVSFACPAGEGGCGAPKRSFRPR